MVLQVQLCELKKGKSYIRKKEDFQHIITVLVNPLFCKEEQIIDGTIFFDMCSMTVRFFGTLKGEKQEEKEIRKWNDHLTNLLGVEYRKGIWH